MANSESCSPTGEPQIANSEQRTARHRTKNSEHRTPNTERRTPNSEQPSGPIELHVSGSVLLVAVSAAIASGVEFVEALTIVLAVGVTKTWRDALEGTAAAAVALVVLVAVLGIGLLRVVPLHALQLGIGMLLLVFGLKWLRKAILRFSGLKAKRDEAKEFQEELERMRSGGRAPGRDWLGVSTAFNGVFLEGTEVVFIVIGLGAAGKALGAAAAGAGVAAVFVILAGIMLHRPLNKVPENTMKFVVGIMLSTFGTLWTGEGLGVRWWKGDLFIPILAAGYLIASWVLVTWLKSLPRPSREPHPEGYPLGAPPG
jgi:Ca2+/H+ antiporter, TMEM165/GDT1 family